MLHDPASAGQAVVPLFARQPVFDARLNIYGYELLYRRALASVQAEFADSDAATLTVVSGAFHLQQGDLAQGQNILVHFGPKTIKDKAPYALPPEKTVVQVSEAAATADPDLLAALAALKADGFKLAVDGFRNAPGSGPLLGLADMVIVDIGGRAEQELAPLAQAATKADARAMAKKVETQERFDMAKSLGFSLFQGFFFKHPSMVAGRRLASNEVARLKLLRLTQNEEPDATALSQAIASDVSLSYRLLAYLNSPLHGQHPSEFSIPRAINVLGWKQLRNWLRIVALTDATPTGKDQELAFLSYQRGKFFELLADTMAMPRQEQAALFALGLFSLLDALLKAPMDELLASLALPDAVASALTDGGGPYAPWLAMVQAFEQGDWPALEAHLRKMAVSTELAASSYSLAMDCARQAVQR